jgi:hypothetical protein
MQRCFPEEEGGAERLRELGVAGPLSEYIVGIKDMVKESVIAVLVVCFSLFLDVCCVTIISKYY